MGDINDRARALLTEKPGKPDDITVEEVKCEPSMRRVATCPFIRDESGKGNYYGIEGIESFLQDLGREKTTTTNARAKVRQHATA
jgi:hypothetical protein